MLSRTAWKKRLADRKYGSTKRGIAPVYGDKYLKKAIHVGELNYPEAFTAHLSDVLEWKNLTLTGVYKADSFKLDVLLKWANEFGSVLRPFITDTGSFT